ncbi:MAG: hypothetical protein WBM41_01155 [Arenicellales bacterium]
MNHINCALKVFTVPLTALLMLFASSSFSASTEMRLLTEVCADPSYPALFQSESTGGEGETEGEGTGDGEGEEGEKKEEEEEPDC